MESVDICVILVAAYLVMCLDVGRE